MDTCIFGVWRRAFKVTLAFTMIEKYARTLYFEGLGPVPGSNHDTTNRSKKSKVKFKATPFMHVIHWMIFFNFVSCV